MDKEKGLAYCGLACCLCGENATCAGCRNGGCADREGCRNRNCCMDKGYRGCWECPDFPCAGTMLDKVRIRAFARYIREFGEADILRALGRNEKNGIVYHHAGTLVGDYDRFDTEERILWLIRTGQ
ncbi:MAG: DUF3795 domain-containing protein [Clostridia bacterium]|nr:DUF3795 domain-containing protein [Clostridia bacterium]